MPKKPRKVAPNSSPFTPRLMPPHGSRYARLFEGRRYVLTVVWEGDKTYFHIGDKRFKTPSAAARSICNLYAVNGWQWWKIGRLGRRRDQISH